MVPVGWGASDSSALSGHNGGVCPPPSTYLGTIGAELADGTGTAALFMLFTGRVPAQGRSWRLFSKAVVRTQRTCTH